MHGETVKSICVFMQSVCHLDLNSSKFYSADTFQKKYKTLYLEIHRIFNICNINRLLFYILQ
jgi:hypothetical protein